MGGSERPSVEISADLNGAIAALAAIGYRSTKSIISGPDCADMATGQVQGFLDRHRCEKYTSATLAARSQGTITLAAITWVTMPTVALAKLYKAEADAPGTGNPPGMSHFNGLCYASGQIGSTVWSEQIQVSGRPSLSADRKLLQAAAPAKLTASYTQQHCVI